MRYERRREVDSRAAAGLEEQELSEEVEKMTMAEAEEGEGDPSQAAAAVVIATWLRLHSFRSNS